MKSVALLAAAHCTTVPGCAAHGKELRTEQKRFTCRIGLLHRAPWNRHNPHRHVCSVTTNHRTAHFRQNTKGLGLHRPPPRKSLLLKVTPHNANCKMTQAQALPVNYTERIAYH